MMKYGLFKCWVEQELKTTLTPEHKFHPKRKWRFDFAIPEKMIAIEIEGGVYMQGRHTRGTGFRADTEKYNEATVLGWKVLRFATQDIMKQSTLETISRLL